jgi:phosphatidylglycerophosphate synthase
LKVELKMNRKIQRPPLPDFEVFWQMRAAQSFWITHYFSYPSGVLLAWCFGHLGVSPSTVTVLGGLIAWLGAAWAALGAHSAGMACLVLLLSLFLSYSLDCADGVLARATRTTSPFGAILDKVIDATTMIVVPGFLCLGAQSRTPLWLPEETYPFIGLGIITGRVVLAITIWLKDFTVKKADHLAADQRQRNLQWHIRRLIGQTTDTPVFYLLLAVTWWVGAFWEMLAGYGIWIFIVWALYLRASAREMASAHRNDEPC